jgi:hypothetical protein
LTSCSAIPTVEDVQTFISHQFHISLEVPVEWQITRSLRSNNVLTIASVDLAIEEVYDGENGKLLISALPIELPVNEVCKILVGGVDDRFGSEPDIKMISTQDQPGCIILPSGYQSSDFYGELAAVVSYPEPTLLGLNLETFHYVLIIAKDLDMERLAQSIRFDITPEEYLSSTLDIIEDTGISFDEDLNWEEVREEASVIAGEAETFLDTYGAIRFAMNALQTGHTFFLTPEQVAGGLGSSPDGSMAVSGSRLENEIGYVALQEINGNLDTLTSYANTLHNIIQDIDQEPVCGWIVSLRGNTGGSMFPMITGLAPIIGEGNIGGFLLVDGQRMILSIENGKVLIDDVVVQNYGELLNEPLYTLKNPMPPVAVLVDRHTASAAEIATLAFIGRPDSRIFGESTSGFTTGNEAFPLFDGALLILSVSVELDRDGNIYSESLLPDEIVSSEASLDAAIEWLLSQENCSKENHTP